MAKPEWGVKRICPECATRFYDLTKDPAICPKCEASFSPAALLKGNKSKTAKPETDSEESGEAVADDDDVVVDDDDAAATGDSDDVTVVDDDDDDDVDLDSQIEIETDKEEED